MTRLGLPPLIVLPLVLLACSPPPSSDAATEPPPGEREWLPATNGLASVDDFSAIESDKARAVALFVELGDVLQHPRCVNCHPNGDRPLQGELGLPHQPLAVRSDDGRGAPGMACTTCHGEDNYLNLPGDAHWHLAPIEMAWQSKSLAEICDQIKDPSRNGGLDLAGLVDHVSNDSLVAYGWTPPEHLEPAPGSQALFAELVQAWIDAGAHCPH